VQQPVFQRVGGLAFEWPRRAGVGLCAPAAWQLSPFTSTATASASRRLRRTRRRRSPGVEARHSLGRTSELTHPIVRKPGGRNSANPTIEKCMHCA
jgi:hypothetical protein